jgi:hypothetical protein
VTPPAPTLTLTIDQTRRLHTTLMQATDHLIRGRISPRLLHDLYLHTARLELSLDQAQCRHDHSKEPHQ